jgi:hypothetical protein
MFRVMGDADDEDVALEIDELGELVIDLRTTFWHPAPPEVASHHLELMEAAAHGATSADPNDAPSTSD